VLRAKTDDGPSLSTAYAKQIASAGGGEPWIAERYSPERSRAFATPNSLLTRIYDDL
jgi:hypothetical protein